MIDNTSGISPTEYKVLIEPVEIDEKVGSIIIPDIAKDTEQHAQMQGILIDASPLAFSYDDWPEGAAVPKPGDKVLFAKYAGAVIDGTDGRKYRIVNDRDIAAILS